MQQVDCRQCSFVSGTLDYTDIQCTLPNNPSLILPLVRFLTQRAMDLGVCDAARENHLAVALEEALRNALFHGNLELSSEDMRQTVGWVVADRQAELIVRRQQQRPYCNRRVHVRAILLPTHADFVIRDEGPGFDYVVCTALVIDDGELERPTGRGVALMHSCMDAVRFNELGNQVTLRINRRVRSSNNFVRYFSQ